jgi:hypothetical protein
MYRPSIFVLVVLVLALWALAMMVVPAALALPLAVDHALYHAILATAVLLPAFVIAVRRGTQPTVVSSAPIVGLATLAVTQLVESVGGLGYGPDGDTRVNELVAFHDIGLAITPIGLVAALVGVVIGVGVLAGRRSIRPALAAGLSALLLVIGGIGVAKLIGM